MPASNAFTSDKCRGIRAALLAGQSFNAQYEFGINVIKMFM